LNIKSKISFNEKNSSEVTQLNRVIIVDDDTDFSESLSEVLEAEKYLVRTACNKLEALDVTREFKPHIAILDIKIGQENGVQLISDLRKIASNILCIMLTGYADMTTVVNALREDAFDYLTKPVHPEEIILKLKHGFEKLELEKYQVITAKALKFSEERYRAIIDNMVNGVIITDIDGKIISFNYAAEAIFNNNSKDVAGENIKTLLKIELDKQREFLASRVTLPGLVPAYHEINACRKNNEEFPLRFSISELPVSDGQKKQLIFSCFDISEQKKQEEQLRQSQKMDALGKLSSGIAHDYNNVLGVITGYAELLKEELGEQHKLARYAHEIFHAGERSSRLTKKLLAFSRKKTYEADMLNLNALLQDQSHMLRKTLTVRINLVLNLAENLWPVWLDSSDMEDAILNISINAMHAIEGNGKLTIKTRNEKINELDARLLSLNAGDYVTLSITDTGSGMDEITREKIFDPFYSTKGNKGTGLGLSQVYGFVARSKGTIKVSTELSHGTKFIFYFPRFHENKNRSQVQEDQYIAYIKGNENILVVDDEPALLELNCKILSQQGYNIFHAENGKQALEILDQKPIDLLFSDIIMPEMNGYELTAIVQKKYPNIKIQLSSGFEDGHHANMVDEKLCQNMLHKPVASQMLLERLRELLDEK